MEYRTYDATLRKWSAWIPCTNSTNNIPVGNNDIECQICFRSIDSSSEFKYMSLILPGRAATPAVSVNWVDESLQNLNTEMEIALGESPFQVVT